MYTTSAEVLHSMRRGGIWVGCLKYEPRHFAVNYQSVAKHVYASWTQVQTVRLRSLFMTHFLTHVKWGTSSCFDFHCWDIMMCDLIGLSQRVGYFSFGLWLMASEPRRKSNNLVGLCIALYQLMSFGCVSWWMGCFDGYQLNKRVELKLMGHCRFQFLALRPS